MNFLHVVYILGINLFLVGHGLRPGYCEDEPFPQILRSSKVVLHSRATAVLATVCKSIHETASNSEEAMVIWKEEY
jgi:hypothetical protein